MDMIVFKTETQHSRSGENTVENLTWSLGTAWVQEVTLQNSMFLSKRIPSCLHDDMTSTKQRARHEPENAHMDQSAHLTVKAVLL